MNVEGRLVCQGCENPDERVVLAQHGISLSNLGLGGKFCGSCLHQELDALGLARHFPEDD